MHNDQAHDLVFLLDLRNLIEKFSHAHWYEFEDVLVNLAHGSIILLYDKKKNWCMHYTKFGIAVHKEKSYNSLRFNMFTKTQNIIGNFLRASH